MVRLVSVMILQPSEPGLESQLVDRFLKELTHLQLKGHVR